MKYVIVGNSAASVGAVEGIRKVDPEGTIMVLSEESYPAYSRPLISYYLAGKVKEEDMYYRDPDFYEKNRVELLMGKKVIGIAQKQGTVEVEGQQPIPYDRLLLAVGSSPYLPPIKGIDNQDYYFFNYFNDVKEIEHKIMNKQVTQPLIIGAGLVGMKAAEALALLGLSVTVVELGPHILGSILSEAPARMVQRRMEEKGIRFIFEKSVKEVPWGQDPQGVILSDGQGVLTDLLIVAAGARPRLELVEELPLGKNQGVKVNQYMQTDLEDIFAAGDVAEGWDTLQEENRVIPIWPGAYRQGFLAGLNMAGLKTEDVGGFALNSIGFFGFPIITAGVFEAKEGNEEVLCREKPNSFLQLVFRNNRLLGFIKVGEVDRAGILTWLIKDRIDCSTFKENLLKPDFCLLDLPLALRRDRMRGGENVESIGCA
ncbi:NAD(P)/FAD-dependent oxidoreductase [Candidatus Contubernalis alkaliaceticus]|uniref:NAD(P)/FAD-dependent oxidoreductase n=1 Tax=Candidatus Contubernalis alkaliaceticus TaxID=338645 RepID=UPI001F4C056C|nr:FAD-dependent oxidoreductase [Candidatus Contubernalis alkalaceticus]UNC91892.1 NAD(P)/FAD-dependent oxidoreductase [Candidatus Contubernalis alkalaceticus]